MSKLVLCTLLLQVFLVSIAQKTDKKLQVRIDDLVMGFAPLTRR
jgi:hypothetical protein